jgi:TPR repeat protein
MIRAAEATAGRDAGVSVYHEEMAMGKPSTAGMSATLGLLLTTLLVSCGTTPPADLGARYFEQGRYVEAADHWSLPASEGDPVAQHNLGLLARDGLGREADLNEAASWYLRSAQQDYVPAMVSLAEVQIILGQDTPANSWLTLAARWGSEEAVDLLEARGLPVPKPDLYTAATEEMQLEKMRATGDMLRPPIRKISTRGADDRE